jgi:hypothetical protein
MTARRARRTFLTATTTVAGAALLIGSTSAVAHATEPATPLQVTVDDGVSLAAAGSTVTYRLSITSADDETDVDATLALSEHLRLVSASDGGASAAAPAVGWSAVRWEGLALAAGGTRTVTATVRVLPSAGHKVTVIGSALGAAGPTTPQPSCAADPQCDLDVTVVDHPAPAASVAPATSTAQVRATAPAKVEKKKAAKAKKKAKAKSKKAKSKKAKAKKDKKGRRSAR